jgi:hypothetical protein
MGRIELDAVGTLESLTGLTLQGIARVFYVFHDEISRDFGALELSFSGGLVFWMESGSDGESLPNHVFRCRGP